MSGERQTLSQFQEDKKDQDFARWQFIPSQAKWSTIDKVKNSKQRIKKAGRQSKIWLSHVKEKHKTAQGMKYASERLPEDHEKKRLVV